MQHTSFPDDRRGGGERFALLTYSPSTKRWEGKLNSPIGKGHAWQVAVRSWSIPPFRNDNHCCSISIKLIAPPLNDVILTVNHSMETVMHKSHMRGMAPRLRWHPLEKTLTDISDISVVIAAFDDKEFAPIDSPLHLVLDFAIDVE